MSDALLALVLAAVFAGVFLTVLVFALPSKASAGSKRRLKQLRWFGGEQEQGTAAQAVAHAQSVLSWADRTIETRANTDRLAVRLEQAGIALRPQEWLLLWGGAAVAGVIVGVVLMPWYVGLPVGALVGVAGPWAYQVFAAKRRVGRFAEQLPDAMQMVVGSLQSGFSLGQALDTVVRETPAPLSTEFGRVLAEVQLGSELEDALERAADRTDSEDLACLVMAIRIQHEVGGSLAEVLTTSVATMRDRFRLHRHVRALSAEGRLSAYVLIGLPVGIGAYMFLFRNDYVRPLYTTFMGMTMLAGAAVMLVIGSFWMSRLIKVEV